MAVTFSGLASGIDTASIVKQLVQLESAPITRMQQTQSDLSYQQKQLNQTKDLLTKLQTAAQALDTRSDVLLSTASTSDDKSVTVTASGAAALGSFDVYVESLATAQRTYSDGVAAKDQAGLVGTGQLKLQVGSGTEVAIDVDAGSTLESIVADINSSGLDLTAGILYTGSEYRIQISGNDTGAANAITITEDPGLTLGLSNPANEVRAAADAVFKIDGFDMTSASNVVGEAIPGVTLTLKAKTDSTTVTVTRDADAIKDKLQAFVDAYNNVSRQIGSQFAYTGQPQVGATLSGDSSLRSIQSGLRDLVSSEVSGLSAPYNTLSAIGIRSQSDGTLKLDGDVLAQVLADDPEAISKVLIKDDLAGVTGMASQFDTAIKAMLDSHDGVLAQRISGITARSKALDTQIDQMQVRIDKYQSNLEQQFSAMEQVLSQLQSQGTQLSAMLSSLQ